MKFSFLWGVLFLVLFCSTASWRPVMAEEDEMQVVLDELEVKSQDINMMAVPRDVQKKWIKEIERQKKELKAQGDVAIIGEDYYTDASNGEEEVVVI